MPNPILPIRRNSTRLDRAVAEETTLARANARVAAAREAARLEAIADVTELALLATAQISAVEGALMERTPHAALRLQHIADTGCAGMAGVVLRTGRAL
jgi:hypothetical protein